LPSSPHRRQSRDKRKREIFTGDEGRFPVSMPVHHDEPCREICVSGGKGIGFRGGVHKEGAELFVVSSRVFNK